MISDKFIIDRVDLTDIIIDINREVDKIFQYKDSEGRVIVLIGERYYFRIESNLATTIIIDHINESQYQIVIVVAGGEHGLLGITWGAESSMLKKIKKAFLKYVKNS
jgi:hypothetical protein